MTDAHTPRLYEDEAPERVWLVTREVYIPHRWSMSALDHGDEYLTYIRSDVHDEMLAALKSARSALDRLYEGFLHNSEAGCEAWDDASGLEVGKSLDAVISKVRS